MALQPQALTLNFASGLDTKADPKQVAFGKFLNLENSIFDEGGLLQKRNGFMSLAALPDTSSTYLTTFNGNLTAIGTKFQAYSTGTSSWVNKGYIQPSKLTTLPLIRSNTNQTYADTAFASNGLVCTVYTDNVPVSGSNTLIYKYAIADSVTGQNIVAPTAITSVGVVTFAPKVFALGRYFMVVFASNFSGTYHLQYIAIPVSNPSSPGTATDISTVYAAASTGTFDGVVANGSLYLAWAGTGSTVKLTYITAQLSAATAVSYASQTATLMSITADTTQGSLVVWAVYHDNGTGTGKTLAVDGILSPILAPTTLFTSITNKANLAPTAQNAVMTLYYEDIQAYTYDSAVPTHRVRKITCAQAGTVSSTSPVARSVGLASKAILLNGTAYMLTAYQSPYQPTYYLINGSGQVITKLAYENSGGYLTTGLPNLTLTGDVVQVPYLYKDLIEAVNKSTNVPAGTQVNGIYAQLGVNLASIEITSKNLLSAEIASNLHVTGGFLWEYDGYQAVEHGFFMYPDSVEATTSTTGGFLTAQPYFYQATYEWADNQGNLYRSAPSIPITVTTTGTTSSVTVNVPTYRLTYKTANPVKLVLYRWSQAQQTYYQVTSISLPTLNDTTVDSIAIVDTLVDSTILGNNILYTNGGTLENIGEPAVDAVALFKSRLMFIFSEDKNLLGFTKQVIENVPVEWNDDFTIYVSPTTSAQINTGPMKALGAMDDKLVIFKENAIYYITGTGPDNTGANNDFSEPQFINSTVGCQNQASIVFQPAGLMFQSDKGIWLLGRDLSTQYIGAPVERYTTGALVTSALNIPGTNQVRFTLDSGVVLMYDYYYGQWGTFVNVPSISSCLYENLHTFINARAAAYQESPGVYLDGTQPVLMAFTTSWLNLAGLRGYERAYRFYLEATYYSPHKLNLNIAYDYNVAPSQSILITPDNYNPNYGLQPGNYGSGDKYGGNGVDEAWRVFLARQKCKSFQITLQEVYDGTYGVPAGQGFSMSGITLVIGQKKGWSPAKASRSAG